MKNSTSILILIFTLVLVSCKTPDEVVEHTSIDQNINPTHTLPQTTGRSQTPPSILSPTDPGESTSTIPPITATTPTLPIAPTAQQTNRATNNGLTTPTTSASMIPGALQPRLLVNISSVTDLVECIPLGGAAIWLLDVSLQKLKADYFDTETNFLLPTWAPNGQEFAYVRSDSLKNAYGFDGKYYPVLAQDSIWLGNIDGNETVKLADKFQRENVIDMKGMCLQSSWITELVWSPDSKKIIIVSVSASSPINWRYEMVDITHSSQTFITTTEGSGGTPIWSPTSDKFILLSETRLLVYKGADEFILDDTLSLPINGSQLASCFWEEPDKILCTVVYPKRKVFDPVESELWTYDFASNNWTLQVGRDIFPGNDVFYTAGYAAIWSEHNISILQTSTWNVISKIPKQDLFTYPVRWLHWQSDTPVLSVNSFDSKIWIIDGLANKKGFFEAFDIRVIRKDGNLHIIDYSWSLR